jgi:minor histocompatibility antigen H13
MKERWEINDHILNLFEKISKYIFCPLLALLLALLYVVSKHWLLNNLFALFFTITAIKYAGVKTFKVAVPILWSLFAYDMYWVYRSDVMVTVAKGIDLPLKLQFPYWNFVGDVEFSILGLGDIVIPGLFLSLCFKYDIDNSILSANRQRVKSFKTPLYYTALGMYFIGLLMTYSALFFFERPQPALVFIVPSLTMSLAANRCFERRLPLCKYHSSAMAKSQENLERV